MSGSDDHRLTNDIVARRGVHDVLFDYLDIQIFIFPGPTESEPKGKKKKYDLKRRQINS